MVVILCLNHLFVSYKMASKMGLQAFQMLQNGWPPESDFLQNDLRNRPYMGLEANHAIGKISTGILPPRHPLQDRHIVDRCLRPGAFKLDPWQIYSQSSVGQSCAWRLFICPFSAKSQFSLP